MMPSTRPPIIAPGTLPRPPSTQTTKALPRNAELLSGEIGKMMLSSAPAAPAIRAPMPKVMALMRLTSTPISAAASRSMRTATMARPIRAVAQQPVEQHREQQRERHRRDPVARQEHRADLDRPERMGQIDRPVVGGERDQHRVVQDEVETERQRERDQDRRRDHAVDDPGLDSVPEHVEQRARDDDRNERMNARMSVGEIGDIGARAR